MKSLNFSKTGLFVGKFIAYHKGHQYFINKFAANCDKLNLILCANTKIDKVSYSIRKNWLEQDLNFGLRNMKKKISLHVSFEDNITPYPEGIKEWCRSIENLVGSKIDIMFGNDDYIKECAQEFGSTYFSPDTSRNKYNISSTKIITNGLKYYDYLNDVSKPYFNEKILIIGSESTGKTTLCKKLTTFFNGEYIEKYGRSYEEEMIRKYNLRCKQWRVKDYESIALTQNEIINDAMERPVKLLFADTDALITQMYCELYLNQQSQIIDEVINSQHFGLILYLDSDLTNWIADGERFLSKERQKVGKIIKEKLIKNKRNFIILKSDKGYDYRLEKAKEIIKDTFKM